MHWATDTEIECLDCGGEGCIDVNKNDAGPHTWPDCKACKGTGVRALTQDEVDDAVDAAYSRQFEGEPPMSARERDEMQAKRDAQWGVR